MAIATYADLKSSIAEYLARSDLTAQIPTFIQLGEVRLRRDLRVRQMLKVVTTQATPNTATVELPSDFLQMRDIHVNSNPVATVEYLSPSAFYRNTFSEISGLPTKYTILAEEFQFAPIPDSNYTLQMIYYAAPPYLSDSNTTNTFTNVCPDLLLYAALAEAEPYLMNDQRVQTWAALYDRGLQALTVSDDQGEYSASPIAITTTLR
jgi:hypothetical protein